MIVSELELNPCRFRFSICRSVNYRLRINQYESIRSTNQGGLRLWRTRRGILQLFAPRNKNLAIVRNRKTRLFVWCLQGHLRIMVFRLGSWFPHDKKWRVFLDDTVNNQCIWCPQQKCWWTLSCNKEPLKKFRRYNSFPGSDQQDLLQRINGDVYCRFLTSHWW